MPNASLVPHLAPKRGSFELLTGFSLPFRALRLILTTPKLFLLSAISGLVTLVSLIAVVAVLVLYVDDLIGSFWARPQAWYALVAWYLVQVLAFVALLVTGANTVPLLLQAPLQDPISEAAEEAVGGFQAPRFSVSGLARGLSTSVVHTVARIVILLAGHAVLLLLNLVPGVGSVVWSVCASLWTIVWAAVEYLGAPMARHLYPFGAVRRAAQARPALTFGFGLAVYLVLWVPVVNLLFIPMAVVGGTLLFRALRDVGAVPALPAKNP